MIVTVKHARSVMCPNGRGYCSRGMRQFAAKHNLDFEDFVHNGIDSSILSAIDDEMVRLVLIEAERDGKQ